MTLLFISDLHLDENHANILHSLKWFIEEKASQADALFILGDLFEVWVGDDYSSPLIDTTIDLLQFLTSKGIDVFFQHGNRDFLICEDFAAKTHCTILPEIHTFDIDGQKIITCHGDHLCTLDEKYMAFRKIVRDANWQNMMLAKPLNERLQMANMLRLASQNSQKNQAEYIMDVTPSEVVNLMESYQATTLIHGHTHRPDIHPLQLQHGIATRYVLGDWDKSGWFLQYKDKQFRLGNFPLLA